MPPNDLDILGRIRFASPCEAAWAHMQGDDRVRHCTICDRLVYNLARLTAAEAVALLRSPGGPPCIQLWRRKDGTVLTADCPLGLRRVAARRRARLALAAAVALGLMGTALWVRALRALPAQAEQGLCDRPLGGAPLPHTLDEPSPLPKH